MRRAAMTQPTAALSVRPGHAPPTLSDLRALQPPEEHLCLILEPQRRREGRPSLAARTSTCAGEIPSRGCAGTLRRAAARDGDDDSVVDLESHDVEVDVDRIQQQTRTDLGIPRMEAEVVVL